LDEALLETAVSFFFRRLAFWVRPVASETCEALVADNLRFFDTSIFLEPVGTFFRDLLPEVRDEVDISLEPFGPTVIDEDTLDLLLPLDPLED